MAEPPRLTAISLACLNSIMILMIIRLKEWQRGHFDLLLPFNQNRWNKSINANEDPVRHGFVHAVGDWIYYLDFMNEFPDRGSCQLLLQFRGVGA